MRLLLKSDKRPIVVIEGEEGEEVEDKTQWAPNL